MGRLILANANKEVRENIKAIAASYILRRHRRADCVNTTISELNLERIEERRRIPRLNFELQLSNNGFLNAEPKVCLKQISVRTFRQTSTKMLVPFSCRIFRFKYSPFHQVIEWNKLPHNRIYLYDLFKFNLELKSFSDRAY